MCLHSHCARALAAPMPPLFTGSHDAIAEALLPFASSPEFLVYGAGLHKSPVVRKTLEKHRQLWQALYALHPRLTWSKEDMQTILCLLAEKQKRAWPRELSPQEVESFAEQMGLRIRTMATHICQARVKQATWVRELLDSAQPDAAGPGSSAGNWLYGFDWDLRRAYRSPLGKPDKHIACDRMAPGAQHPAAFWGEEAVVIKAISAEEYGELFSEAAAVLRRPSASPAAVPASAEVDAVHHVSKEFTWQGTSSDGKALALHRRC